MGQNKQISGEVSICFRKKVLKFIKQFIFTIQREVLIMYYKFEYKLQKSTLITFSRCLPRRKK